MPTCDTCGHDASAIQAKMEKRIAEQGERIKETTAMLSEARARATELESRATELDARVKEYSQREEALSLREAETSAGWSLDDRGRKLARWAYEDAHEAVDAAERPSFSEWLKSDTAKADPVLATYRQGATASGPSKPGAPAVPPKAPPAPPVNGGTVPPTRRTLDQINAEARSIMGSNIPAAEKSAKLAELKAMRDQAATSPTGS